MSAEELEFVTAIEAFKKEKTKAFLSWSEVLSIFKSLGYRKSELHRRKKSSSKKSTTKA